MPLDTLANVKLALGVTGTADDAALTQLQAAADGYVERHCGRSFVGGTFTELHPGGGRAVFLRNYPVAAVTSVEVDPARQFGPATVRDPAGYVVLADRGVVENRDGPFVRPRTAGGVGRDEWPGAVRVVYTTPADAVPPAVQRAYAELIGHWFRQAKTHAALGQQDQLSQFVNGILITYPGGLSGGFALPPGVLQVLNLYRDRPA